MAAGSAPRAYRRRSSGFGVFGVFGGWGLWDFARVTDLGGWDGVLGGRKVRMGCFWGFCGGDFEVRYGGGIFRGRRERRRADARMVGFEEWREKFRVGVMHDCIFWVYAKIAVSCGREVYLFFL